MDSRTVREVDSSIYIYLYISLILTANAILSIAFLDSWLDMRPVCLWRKG